MLRKLLFKFSPFLLAFLATACAGAVEQVPTAVPATPTLPPVTLAPTPTNQPGCSVVSSPIVPETLANSPIPSINAQDWARGPEDASLQVIEYGDFQ
jgi:hypothetical protein